MSNSLRLPLNSCSEFAEGVISLPCVFWVRSDSGAATKCPRWARPSTRTELCTGNLAYFVFSCEAVHKLMVKSVGKPDARSGHVRFDERGRETTG